MAQLSRGARKAAKERQREIDWQQHVAAEFEHFFPERLKPKPVPMRSIEVNTAEEAWAVLTWALARAKPTYAPYPYTQLFDREVAITRRTTRTEDDGVAFLYHVVFPQSVWDEAKAGHTDAHAEKKVHDEIFGKGK